MSSNMLLPFEPERSYVYTCHVWIPKDQIEEHKKYVSSLEPDAVFHRIATRPDVEYFRVDFRQNSTAADLYEAFSNAHKFGPLVSAVMEKQRGVFVKPAMFENINVVTDKGQDYTVQISLIDEYGIILPHIKNIRATSVIDALIHYIKELDKDNKHVGEIYSVTIVSLKEKK